MKKFMVPAIAALMVVGQAGAASAQWRSHGYYRGGYYGGWHHNGGWGGALAAGLIGGALIGGLAASAATPYGYGYPAYGYGYGPYYGAPAYYPRTVYYRPAYAYPYRPYGGRVIYNSPVYSADPYAAPHEIRDGWRTVYVPGRGRVPVAPIR
jgi:hypothetical protein